MQWRRSAVIATCGAVLAANLALGVSAHAETGGLPEVSSSAADALLGAPLRAPLDSLRVTGGFGETRSGHFHAGFDFSTRGRVGRPVRSPVAGWVERARSSGVGYGRSLYLRADDGRLLVFGHLDAYSTALAMYVDSAQRLSGHYEQDTWPAAGRFRFAVGDTIAWSGQSGAGGPHLHMEIRHGDFAIYPLRAGLVLPRPAPPRLVSLTLEPLDADSRVAGGIWPRTFPLHPRPDTIEVEGRLRAAVRSANGIPGAQDAPAWSTSLAWAGETVEARLDSISWAGEMSEQEQLVDHGRLTGSGGLILWAPAGWRPRFVRTSAPLEHAAGVIEVRRGDPPRHLLLTAREPGGAVVERVVVLRPPTRSVPPLRPAARAANAGEPVWAFTSLPGPRLRVRVTGTPAALEKVRIACARDSATARPAQWDGRGWVALLEPTTLPDTAGFSIEGRESGGLAWRSHGAFQLWPAGDEQDAIPAPGVRVRVGTGRVFERGILLVSVAPPIDAPGQGLHALGPRLWVWPEGMPLRRSAEVTIPVGSGVGPKGLGIYRSGARAWEWEGANWNAQAGSMSAESGDLGEFAVMRDFAAPQVKLLTPARSAPRLPYSSWQLVATVAEVGSGIDASESAFVVDGVHQPTEWDPEMRQLRWRPLAPPGDGAHTYELRAVDRAGNVKTIRGIFVLDSSRR